MNEFDSRPRGVPLSLEPKVWSAVGFKSQADSHVTVIHLKHTHTKGDTPRLNVPCFLVETGYDRGQLLR